MGTFNVLDASGNPQSVTNNANGREAAADSAPVALSTEDKTALDAVKTATEATQAAVEGTLTVGLPSGASTSAKQDDIISELQDVNTNLTTPVTVLPVQPMMAEGAATANLSFSEVRINATASGDTSLVSATASQNTKVYRFFLIAAAAVTVQFRDGSTVLAEFPLAANQMFGLGFEQYPWFTGTDNTAFNINLSSAVSVQGRLYYIKSAT